MGKRIAWMLAACCLMAFAVTAETTLRRRMGLVQAADNQPVVGAKVWVIGARPLAGEGKVCPSTFAGVGKMYVSGVEGTYEMTDLDPRLTYDIVVAAVGAQVSVQQYVSSTATKQLVTRLRTAAKDRTDPIKGKVADAEGKAIFGAVIEQYGEKKTGPNNSESYYFGGVVDADQWAVTDHDGTFALPVKGAGRTMYVRVTANGYAPQAMMVTSGEQVGVQVTLTRGASVTGRLVKDGQPMAGVEMLLGQVNRSSDQDVGRFCVGTDEQGRFVFEHLPENMQLAVIGAMNSLGSRGSTAMVKTKTGATGETVDVGDIAVEPALTIRGTCVMEKGVALPKRLDVNVTPQEGMEGLSANVAADGSFKVSGLRPGVVSLHFYANPQVKVSDENECAFDHGEELLGKIDKDTTIRVKLIPKPKNETRTGYTGEQHKAAMEKTLEGVRE